MVKVKPVKLRKYRHRETKKKSSGSGDCFHVLPLDIISGQQYWAVILQSGNGFKILYDALVLSLFLDFWWFEEEGGGWCRVPVYDLSWCMIILLGTKLWRKKLFFHLSSWPHVWTVQSNACFKPLHVSMFVSCWVLTIQFVLSNISCSTGSGCFLQSSKHVLLILVGIVDKLGVSDLC